MGRALYIRCALSIEKYGTFLTLSLLVFPFILPFCLSLFITYFYRCVSLLPVTSFLFLCHLFFRTRFLFLYSFLYLFLSLYQYFHLYCALFFLGFLFIFLCFFRFSIYTTLYRLLLSFVASSYARLFSLPSLSSFSPNKFIRNKL